MTAPTIDLERAVCWCPACGETSSDPAYAEHHHDQTGHETHRRAWRVETFTKENNDQ